MTEQNQTPDIAVEDSADDAEGHVIRADNTTDTDDTEGHLRKADNTTDTDDTEGHFRKA
jgi:hypothetical protein